MNYLEATFAPVNALYAWWLGTGPTLHQDGRLGNGFYDWDRWEPLQ